MDSKYGNDAGFPVYQERTILKENTETELDQHGNYQKEVNVFYEGHAPENILGKIVRYSGAIPIDNPLFQQTDSSIKSLVPDYKSDKGTMEDPALVGPGGAPTRATTLPTDGAARKNFPIASGVLDYFPDALVALSEISKAGNDQHNAGLSLRWDRSKSQDEADTCIRHFLQRGTLDTDGMRHTAKAAWRLLALLQKEIEAEQGKK